MVLDIVELKAHSERLRRELNAKDPCAVGVVSCAWHVIESALISTRVDPNELHPIRVKLEYLARPGPGWCSFGPLQRFTAWD